MRRGARRAALSADPLDDALLEELSAKLSEQLAGVERREVTLGVACSGGLDSMCLADALVRLARSDHGLSWSMTPVVYTVDHGLHGRSSEWALAVVEYWSGREVESRRLMADPGLIQSGQGLEDGARRARYQALEEAAQARGCDLVLLAHHAQDQVETLLMRLQGPTGARGLGGIPARRGPFLRPWLSLEREQLARYAERQQLPIFEDPTNGELRWLRNRVRRWALPSLAQAFEPGWAPRMHQSARQLREHVEGAHWFVCQALQGRVLGSSHRVQLSWPEGLEAPQEAQRLALLMVWRAAWGRLQRQDLDGRRVHDHLEPLLSLWRGGALSQRQLPHGLWAWGARGSLTIDATLSLESPQLTSESSALITSPGVSLPWGRWKLSVTRAQEGERSPHSIPLARAPLPWRLRAPRSGERLHLLGAPGSKPIRQLWARAQVPPIERDTLPLLVDGEDTVIWAPQLRPADHIKGGAGERWALSFELQEPLSPLSLTSPLRAPGSESGPPHL